MFIDDDYDNDRQDAIQGILNSAMGSAANSLARVIDSDVEVNEPSTHWVNKNNLDATLANIHLPKQSIAMRQSFRGPLRGEILILLEHGASHHRLGKVMGYNEKMSSRNIQELTLELTNILSGACISGLSDELDVKLHFGSPSIISQKTSVNNIFSKRQLQWTDALFMDVSYTVNSISLKTNLILCMIEEDSQILYQLIDQKIDNQNAQFN